MTFDQQVNEIAIRLAALAEGTSTLELREAIYDEAHRLSALAGHLEKFDLEEREGVVPTPRQALALGRFLSTTMRDDRYELDPGSAGARVSRGGAGLPDTYLLVQLGDGYTGGIDREGRTST
jgi:hypothetical protein